MVLKKLGRGRRIRVLSVIGAVFFTLIVFVVQSPAFSDLAISMFLFPKHTMGFIEVFSTVEKIRAHLRNNELHEAEELIKDLRRGGMRLEDAVLPVELELWVRRGHLRKAVRIYRSLTDTSETLNIPPDIRRTIELFAEQYKGRTIPTKILFEPVTENVGVDFEHVQRGADRIRDIVDVIGSGGMLGDLDGDGDLDLLLIGGNYEGYDTPGNALYENVDGMFVDRTEASGLASTGLSMGVAAADFDGDELPEVAISGVQGVRFFHNLGGLQFEEITASAGLDIRYPDVFTGLSIGDLSGDELLDIYAPAYVAFPLSSPRENAVGSLTYRFFLTDFHQFTPFSHRPGRNRLFLQESPFRFADVSESMPEVMNSTAYGFTSVIADYNGDQRQDVFVPNDATPNMLLMNQGEGGFRNVSKALRVADARGSMGADLADNENDGVPDIFITNMTNEHNAFLQNKTGRDDNPGYFAEVTDKLGLQSGSIGLTGWGVAFRDFDLDGDNDLFIASGSPIPYEAAGPDRHSTVSKRLHEHHCVKEPQRVFEQTEDGYHEVSIQSGFPRDKLYVARGVLAGDIDDDGLVDLVLTMNNDTVQVYRNVSERQGDWLKVKLLWKPSNRLAVGSRVMFHTRDRVQTQWVTSGGGYLTQQPFLKHFGIREGDEPRYLQITWPDGEELRVPVEAVNTTLVVNYEDVPGGPE